jgi:hypothetical protein
MRQTGVRTSIVVLLLALSTLGCSGDGLEQATCEQQADQFVTELRNEVFSALVSNEDIDVSGVDPLQEEDISDCAERELQELLAEGVTALMEEVYASPEFAEADVAQRHTVGNQLAILVLALSDAIPTSTTQ